MNIQLFFTAWLLCVIALSFIKLKWSVALFLAYLMLVPYINIGIPGLGTGDNLIKLIIIIGYFWEHRRKKHIFNIKPFIPFIIYFTVSLIMIPFQYHVPSLTMLDYWRKDVMNILFFPIIIWNIMRIDSSSIGLFRNTMIICIVIANLYGLFLAVIGGGINPYTMYFLSFMDVDTNFESFYEASGGGRLFGRISSVFIHPMTYALFVGLSIIYIYYIRNRIGIFLTIFMMSLVGVMSVLCGIRSVLGGLFVAIFYYFLIGRKYKLMLTSVIILIIGMVFLSSIPDLSSYIGSIIDFNNKNGDVSGSSVEMRLDQLEGAIAETSKNPFFGLGYRWTHHYMTINGDHPICLAFESLIFVVLCNSGLIGIFLWMYMVYCFITTNKRYFPYQAILINTLLFFYISYSSITGEYGYMKVFLIFYALMIGETCNIRDIGKKKKYNCCGSYD